MGSALPPPLALHCLPFWLAHSPSAQFNWLTDSAAFNKFMSKLKPLYFLHLSYCTCYINLKYKKNSEKKLKNYLKNKCQVQKKV